MHGGEDDLNHAMMHLSWKEILAGFLIMIMVFLIILLAVVLLS